MTQAAAPDSLVADAEQRRELAPVGDVLDEVLGRFAGKSPASGWVVVERWDTIAGPPWRKAKPVKIDENGVLWVVVPDGVSATKLRYETKPLIAAIEREVGPDVVKSVRIKVSHEGGRSAGV